jgi:hypothetical protein
MLLSLLAIYTAPSLRRQPAAMNDLNPLFDGDVEDDASSSTSSADGASYTDTIVATPPTTVLQTVNIRHHVPVELDLQELC